MKNIIILMIAVTALCCSSANSHQRKAAITCTDWKCLEENKNKEAAVEGVLRKYTPNEKGKGAGHMFWDWEVLLSDSNAVPARAADIDLAKHENKKVSVKCLVFYGTVIGSNEPNAQSATGYRLDIRSVEEK